MMQFIDLQSPYQLHKEAINARIQQVLDHGQYIMGPEVFALEEQLQDFTGSKYCIACSSGTDALLLALMALEIGPGDEVITSAFSFFASAEVIALLGATPVFVDIEDDTHLMDANKLEAAITARTRAIIPVSLYGQCCDMEAINTIASKRGIHVIEDAAQSFGARYQKKSSCNLSEIACTSFFPSKPLGCYGDGGACFTNDESLAEKLRMLRVHGQSSRYRHSKVGINGRLDTIQAAILLEKLNVFPEEIKKRQELGSYLYKEFLGIEQIRVSAVRPDRSSVFAQFTLRVEQRDFFAAELNKLEIPTAVHYPKTLPQQECFTIEAKYPISETAAEQVLSLPFHPYLSDEDLAKISDSVRRVAKLL